MSKLIDLDDPEGEIVKNDDSKSDTQEAENGSDAKVFKDELQETLDLSSDDKKNE